MKRLLDAGRLRAPLPDHDPGVRAAALEVFAAMVEQGLVYRDLKPVHWSIANETALAEAELEYFDRVDPSVFVRLRRRGRGRSGRRLRRREPSGRGAAFLIWTTTPWTLPANLLIAVHEEFKYVLASARRAGRLVVAEELLEPASPTSPGGLRRAEIEVPRRPGGFELVGLTYRSPVRRPRRGRIVAADYVTLEDGTGLVHTAPGHGTDDYLTGLREGPRSTRRCRATAPSTTACPSGCAASRCGKPTSPDRRAAAGVRSPARRRGLPATPTPTTGARRRR